MLQPLRGPFAASMKEIDWSDGDGPQNSTYIPVDSGSDIETLKDTLPLDYCNSGRTFGRIGRRAPTDQNCAG
jgi:hypothetical protein